MCRGRAAGPKGRLRIDVPSPIGRLVLIPRLCEFRARYPEVELVIGMGDRMVDLVREAVDCVIRAGDLQDSTLVAPSDGTLLTRAVEPGTVLNEGGTVFTVSLTRPVWVRAYVDERNLDQAQPGRKVLLYTDGRPDKPYHGQIGFVSPTAEFTPKTVETPDLRTDLVYRLRIVVTDADDALRQGMPVTVQFGDEAGHE